MSRGGSTPLDRVLYIEPMRSGPPTLQWWKPQEKHTNQRAREQIGSTVEESNQEGGLPLTSCPFTSFFGQLPLQSPGQAGQATPRHAWAAARPVRRGRTPLCIFLSLHTHTATLSLVAIATLPALPTPPFSCLPKAARTRRSIRPSIAATIINNGRCLHHVAATSVLGGTVLHSNSRGLHEARSFLQLCKRDLLFDL